MNTVIIPVDFSETAVNAATYGIKLLSLAPEAELILYNVYENDDSYENRMEALERLKEELLVNRTANITLLAERGDFVTAYHKRLTSDDEDVRLSAARSWSVWEGSTSKLYPDKDLMEHWEGEHEALSLARIECHYFMNNSFFPTENYLL